LDWRKLNLPTVLFGGVGAGDGLGAGSLILIVDALFLTFFWGFFFWGGVATALHLPARVLEDPAPWPTDESSADLALWVLAKNEFESLLKLGMVEKKLYGTCNWTWRK
jgi:hypothetical protein